MALIKCKECGNEISKKAKGCPNCGAPAKKKTSVITWLVAGFLGLVFLGAIVGNDGNEGAQSRASKQKTYPTSNVSYSEINSEVGCDSKYSDDKKEDIFKSKYKNHWITWKGVVVLAEADNVSLNIDNFGTQDLQVNFSDKNAGYDLVKDSVITVTFLMSSAGGCFLPFSGKHAVIQN